MSSDAICPCKDPKDRRRFSSHRNRPFAGWHDRPWSIDDCRDRCHRLKKPCSAQLPAPPRKRKAPKPTRVAELEKRLEELTARVESRQPQPPHSVDGESIFEVESPARKIRRTSFPDTRLARQQPGYTHIFASDNAEFHDQQRKQYLLRQKQNATKHRAKDIDTDSTAARLTAIATDSAEDGDRMTSRLPALQTHLAPRMADSTSSSSVTASNTSVIGTPPQLRAWSDRGTSEVKDPWYYPSSDEACQILVDFHSHFMPLFPFVVLPTDMGHEELRRDRPLLWKAILMQGLYFSAGRQVAMGDELLNTIIATAFLESKKSLDLLQALEILIAWSVFFLHAEPIGREADRPFSKVLHELKKFSIDKSSFLIALDLRVFRFQRVSSVLQATGPYCDGP